MDSATRRSLLLANVAQASLTFIVWFYMFHIRIPYMQHDRRARGWQQKKTRNEMAPLLAPVAAPADNFQNLCEFPVLFYAVSGLMLASGLPLKDARAESTFVTLAWAFVAFRVGHSAVHCSRGNVSLRFILYALSCGCVMFMWMALGSVAWDAE